MTGKLTRAFATISRFFRAFYSGAAAATAVTPASRTHFVAARARNVFVAARTRTHHVLQG